MTQLPLSCASSKHVRLIGFAESSWLNVTPKGVIQAMTGTTQSCNLVRSVTVCASASTRTEYPYEYPIRCDNQAAWHVLVSPNLVRDSLGYRNERTVDRDKPHQWRHVYLSSRYALWPTGRLVKLSVQ